MSANGHRKPPRPRIEMRSAAPPAEAAAVVAAIERFMAETAPAPARRDEVNPWQRAALLEGVGGHGGWSLSDPWGEPRGGWGASAGRRPD